LKKGAIVCISGKVPRTWTEKDEADFRRTLRRYDAVQIIAPRTPLFLLNRIWFKMILGGVTDFVLTRARFRGKGKLEFSGESFRFQAVGIN
jgi:hypothetical protein